MFSLGSFFGISDTIAGMTVLAIGNAVPDLVTSVIMAKRKNEAEMGICAAIASNRFATLIGLGLPWFIKIIVNWVKTGHYSESYVAIGSTALPFNFMILLVVVCLLYLTFQFCSWQLSMKFSCICLFLYITFISVAITLEIEI